jgi:hypothetical protein
VASADLSNEELAHVLQRIGRGGEVAKLASVILEFRQGARDFMAGAVLAFLVDTCDVDLDVAIATAREMRSDREAEFGSGNCCTMDNPPKA